MWPGAHGHISPTRPAVRCAIHVAADDAPAAIRAGSATLAGTVVPLRDNGYTPTVCDVAGVITTTGTTPVTGKFAAVAGSGAARYSA